LSLFSLSRAQTGNTSPIEPASHVEPAKHPTQGSRFELLSAQKIEPLILPLDSAPKEVLSRSKIDRRAADNPPLSNQGNGRSQTISREIQNSLGSAVDPEQIRPLLHGNPRSVASVELLKKIKEASKPLLAAER